MKRLACGLAFVLATAIVAAQVARVTENSGKDVSLSVAFLDLASVDCSGANTACYIAGAWRQNAAQTFTSFTHSGSTVTALTATNCQNGGCLTTAYICNGGGSGNLRMTLSAAANLFFGYVKLSGVDCAGTPVGTTAVSDSAGGANTTVTTAVTTVTNGLAVDAFYLRDEGTTNVPTAGQTLRFFQNDSGSMGLFSSTKPHTATSLGWTWTAEGALHFVHSVTPFRPSAGGAVTVTQGLSLKGCCE